MIIDRWQDLRFEVKQAIASTFAKVLYAERRLPQSKTERDIARLLIAEQIVKIGVF